MTHAKKLAFAAGLAAGLLAFGAARAEPVAFILDKSHQYIAFEATHFGFSPVRARFQDVEVTLSIDEAAPEKSTVSAVIQAASVDSDHEPRDNHIRSPDFLNAKDHPTIEFKSTAIELKTKTRGVLTGDLTLMGVTKPVAFEFEMLKDGALPFPSYKNARTLAFKASGTIKRSEFGMKKYVGPIADEVKFILQFDVVNCVGEAAKAPSCTYGRS